MDVDQELEVFIKALDFAEAAGGAEWLQPPRTRPSPPVPAAAPASAPPSRAASEPGEVGEPDVVEPIFTRRRGGSLPPTEAPLPGAAKGQGDRHLWVAAVAAGAFVASSVAFAVTAAMPGRSAPPVILRVVKVAPPPAVTATAAAPVGMPVPQPQSPLPASRPWAIKDLPNLGGMGFAPPMGEAQLELLKKDLRKTLQDNGYLPPGYSPPSLPTRDRQEGLAPGVRFTSTNAAHEGE